MTKLNQSILYFSKFFNMYFEPEVMWNLLSQGTNEQINISHLSNALSSYVKNTSLDSINSNIVKLRNDLDSHISNKTIHLSTEEKSFLGDIMTNPPWTNSSGGGGYSESFFELIDIGNGEYALVPKKYKGKNVGIISDTFITAGGINSNSSDSEITFNRLDNWEDYDENAGDVLSAVLGFDLKQRIEIIERNGTLNETQLSIYLSKNKYLTRTVADTIYASLNSFEDFKKEIESKILWEKINIGTETSPIWAVIPKDINGNSVGVISNTFITAGGINSDNNSSSQILTLGNLINVNDSVDDIENNSVVLIKEANSTEWSVKLLSDIGFNESQLSEFLIRNEYLKKSTADTTYASLSSFNTLNNKFTDFLEGSDTDSIINKWKELEEFLAGQTESSTLADLLSVKADKTDVNTIQGYFTNGSANNALKLGNQLPSYYATSSALSTTNTNLSNHITAYNSFVTATNNSLTNHNNRLNSLENMFEWDGSRIKAKADFYSIGAVTAGGVSDGGSIGNIFNRLDTWDNYDANSGDVLSANLGYELYTSILRGVKNPYALTINGTPYDGSSAVNLEVSIGVSGDYLPLSGGMLSANAYVLGINRTGQYSYQPSIEFYDNGTNIGSIGVDGNKHNPFYYDINTLKSFDILHSGNTDALVSSYYTVCPVPSAGTIGEITKYPLSNIQDLSNYKSFIGSATINGVFWNVISARHRNGYDDGYKYGFYLRTKLTDNGDLVWDKQMSYKGWQGERVIIDSSNIGSYITGGGTPCLPLSGGTMNDEARIVFRGNNSYGSSQWQVFSYGPTFQIKSADYGSSGYYMGLQINKEGIVSLRNGDNGRRTNIHPNGSVQFYGATSGWAMGIEYYHNNGTYIGNAAGALGNNNTFSHYFYGGSYDNAAMYIKQNGNVLIGTTTDKGNKLYVDAGTANNYVAYFNSNFSKWGFSYANIGISHSGAQKTAIGWNSVPNTYDVGNTPGSCLYNTESGNAFGLYNEGGAYITCSTTVYGNFTATGEVTSGSDERYKRIESYAEIDIETIANAPIINFKWTDREDDKLHLGSTAQYWYNTSLLNGVSPTDDDKLWTMGYGQIALASVVSVAKKVVNHEERIKVLEEENKQLKQQLNEYRRA